MGPGSSTRGGGARLGVAATAAALVLAGALSPVRATPPPPRPATAVAYAYSEKLGLYDVSSGESRVLAGDDQWINGQSCVDWTGNPATSHLFVGADPEITPKNPARPVKQGWSIYNLKGEYKGFLDAGQDDAIGCALDRDGNLFGTNPGGANPAESRGGLFAFFKADGYRTPCTLDTGLAQPGVLAMDDDASLLVPLAGGAEVRRYRDLPTSIEACKTWKAAEHREPFIQLAAGATPIGIARRPSTGTWAVSSVAGPPMISEFTHDGRFLRTLVAPGVPKNPVGLGWSRDGTQLYYVELALGVSPSEDPGSAIGTEENGGALQRVSFGPADVPSPPETVHAGDMSFADGVGIMDRAWFAKWKVPTGVPDVWTTAWPYGNALDPPPTATN